MEVHNYWTTTVLVLIGLWFLVVTLSGWIATRPTSRDVTRRSRPTGPDPSLLDLATAGARERVWRFLGRALLAVGAQRSGRSLTRRAARLEVRRRRLANAAAHLDARTRAWSRTLGSSISSQASPPSPPPSAPRRPLDPAEEETRRFERTLPWGTPSPLLTREGIGKPYPFVPLAPPLPSSGTVYRSPPRPPRPKPLPLPYEPTRRRR